MSSDGSSERTVDETVDETLDEMSRLNNDLTNLHRELARKTAELERLDRRKNEMLGMVAHDLRNPLGAIIGFAEFIARRAADRLTERELDLVVRIQASSARMSRLIDDLLDVSAIESGALTLDRRRHDLAALLRDATELEMEVAGAPRKGIVLQLELPDGPVYVDVDRDKFEQVVGNLISNAVKYSHTGTTVTVTLVEGASDVELVVVDEGQGIPPEEVGRLFEPFGRTSVQTTAGESSTGLGLAIVRRVVEGHGGDISVASEVGRGSRFHVRLPKAASGG